MTNNDPQTSNAESADKHVKAIMQNIEQNEAKPERPATKWYRSTEAQVSIIIACVALVTIQVVTHRSLIDSQYVVDTSNPGDLSEYCSGLLNDYIDEQTYLDQPLVREACPDPLKVSTKNSMIIVESPDPDSYGFSKIYVDPTRSQMDIVVE